MPDEIVYSRFEKTKQDGTTVKLKIQDMRKCDTDTLIEFMQKWFIHEESLFRASGVNKSEEALKEMRTRYLELCKNKVALPLVCYVDDEEKMDIVGCNVLYAETKDKVIPSVESEEWKTLLRISNEMHKDFDELSRFDVELCLRGVGLSVDPSYRGCGIATELLKARKPMMSVRAVAVTSAWFTSSASQKAAKRAGYEEMVDLTYEELTRRTGVIFTDVPKSLKLMVLRA